MQVSPRGKHTEAAQCETWVDCVENYIIILKDFSIELQLAHRCAVASWYTSCARFSDTFKFVFVTLFGCALKSERIVQTTRSAD